MSGDKEKLKQSLRPKDEETARKDVLSEANSEDDLNDYEKEILGETEGLENSESPETEQDGATDGREMGFTDDQQDQEEDTLISDDAAGDVEISNKELEEYILQNRPVFPDADFDFPALVEQRRNGATWMGFSREIGIPRSQLNSKFRKYKDYVKKLMQDGGAA